MERYQKNANIKCKEVKLKMMSQLIKFWRSRPPFPILLICIFEFLGLLAIPHAIFNEGAASIGSWYQVYIGLTSLMTIAIIYFLWRMDKKGIFIYIGAYFIHNVVALFASNWMIGVLIIPVVGIILISFCIKRFNWKTNDNKQRNADSGANEPPPVR